MKGGILISSPDLKALSSSVKGEPPRKFGNRNAIMILIELIVFILSNFSYT